MDSGTATTSKRLLTLFVAAWLGIALAVTASARDTQRSNWTTPDLPCDRYGDIRRPVLGEIGVRIDAAEPWAKAFRRALSFWNTVLVANFHEEPKLSACAIRIVNGGPEILSGPVVARSQFPAWVGFEGKIAVTPKTAGTMTSGEMYGTAVHELGHMLGLRHNSSSRSIMYFLDVNGSEALDSTDVLDLSTHHKLRPNIVASIAFLPIQMARR